MNDKIVQWASALQGHAQAGLYYSKDPFDLERYRQIREIAAEMMAERTGLPALAEEKCSAEQIQMCFRACQASTWTAQFD